MGRLYLVRHGESTWNSERRFQGQSDPPLSAVGHWQARQAAAALADLPLAAVYSSPLARALYTAHVIAEPHALPVATVGTLVEVHGGLWQGLTEDEIEERWPGTFSKWRLDGDLTGAPDAESLEAAMQRGLGALRQIAVRHAGEQVAAVTHGGLLRAVLKRLGLWPPDPSARLHNGSITIVQLHNEPVRLETFDEVSHVRRERGRISPIA